LAGNSNVNNKEISENNSKKSRDNVKGIPSGTSVTVRSMPKSVSSSHQVRNWREIQIQVSRNWREIQIQAATVLQHCLFQIHSNPRMVPLP
jgi:hypothetical protein